MIFNLFNRKKNKKTFTKDQKSLCVPVDPIENLPIYNLVFHFHCMDHEKVWYAIDKLSKHMDIFTGYKIFTMSSPNNRFLDNEIFNYIVDKFKNYPNVYFIPVINDLETREVSHFFNYAMPLLTRLADMSNKKSYTLYAHSKGCSKAEKDYAITCWVNTLYKYNLDLFETLIKPNLLSNYYKFVGCMKTEVGSNLGAKYHYAGTFFWFDSDIIRYSDWHKYKKHILGLEMWPNTVVDSGEMFSVFDLPLDVQRHENYYKMDYWYNLVVGNTVDQPKTTSKPEKNNEQNS